MTARFRRVAVLGLGLIGGSILQALRRGGIDSVGYDIDPATAELASAAGYPVTASAASAVRGAELVVLAMPLPQLAAAVAGVAGALAEDAIVTDVGTLKQPVLAAVRQGAPAATFVGGHPLAGVENTGWGAADSHLFRDAPWALTLEDDTDLAAWLRVAELVCDLGAKPVPASATAHDAAVARVIGLPHMLAETLALTGLRGGPLGLSLAAGSYLSGARVARTRPELVATWCDDNPALVDALTDVITRLTTTRDELAAGRSVQPLADAGHRALSDWETRHFAPVELGADRAQLRALGDAGGLITAVLRDDADVRLLGMRPVDRG